jgi:hypothetical protein
MKGTDWLKARPATLLAGFLWIATLQRSPTGGYFLRRKLIAKRPLRLARDDNKNSHRAETRFGLRLIGQPSRR